MHKEQTITVSAMEAAEFRKPKTRQRPREREDRKEDILQAALSACSERDCEATRIDDVADQAEITKGNIYLYFKSKENLFEGVITRWITPTIEQVERLSISEDLASEEARRGQEARRYTLCREYRLKKARARRPAFGRYGLTSPCGHTGFDHAELHHADFRLARSAFTWRSVNG